MAGGDHENALVRNQRAQAVHGFPEQAALRIIQGQELLGELATGERPEALTGTAGHNHGQARKGCGHGT